MDIKSIRQHLAEYGDIDADIVLALCDELEQAQQEIGRLQESLNALRGVIAGHRMKTQ